VIGSDRSLLHLDLHIERAAVSVWRDPRGRSEQSCEGRRHHVTVLLTAKAVGKEMVARAVHQISGRLDKPFVKAIPPRCPRNCSSPELFGAHEKGPSRGLIVAKPENSSLLPRHLPPR